MTMRRYQSTTHFMLAAGVLVCLMLWATSAGAQTAITGATVHPIEGEPIENGVVVIGKDGLIEAVGGEETEIPESAKKIDAEGKVVTPGLIDARTRLGLVEIWAVDKSRDFNRGGAGRIRAAFQVADGFNPNSVAIPVTRTGGVTSSVIVPGGGLVAGQSAWIDLRGTDLGHATVAAESTAMHFDFSARGSNSGLRSRGAILEVYRELYDDVVFFRDNAEAFNENRSRRLTASRLDLKALQKTLEQELPSVFNVQRASDIETVLEFADERGLDPVLTGATEAWKVADSLAEANVPVVVNPVLNLPSHFSTLGARTENAALLAEAGVPVVLSTFGTHNVRKLRQLAGNAVRAGMEHEDALRAVTLNAAKAFGMANQYGSLAKGKVGNVVIWTGDPFELSTRVEEMYVRGEEVTLDNRQRKLFERYRKLERRGEPATENSSDEQ